MIARARWLLVALTLLAGFACKSQTDIAKADYEKLRERWSPGLAKVNPLIAQLLQHKEALKGPRGFEAMGNLQLTCDKLRDEVKALKVPNDDLEDEAARIKAKLVSLSLIRIETLSTCTDPIPCSAECAAQMLNLGRSLHEASAAAALVGVQIPAPSVPD